MDLPGITLLPILDWSGLSGWNRSLMGSGSLMLEHTPFSPTETMAHLRSTCDVYCSSSHPMDEDLMTSKIDDQIWRCFLSYPRTGSNWCGPSQNGDVPCHLFCWDILCHSLCHSVSFQTFFWWYDFLEDLPPRHHDIGPPRRPPPSGSVKVGKGGMGEVFCPLQVVGHLCQILNSQFVPLNTGGS